MNPDLAIDIFKTTVIFALYIVAPFLIAALVVGLLTSLVQSVTSMQEPTLTFIPKLLTISGLSILLAPWLLREISEFAVSTMVRMSTMGH
ncbi:MAG TPA: flagellar biosynthetic protein FliQ [Opitutaceae bacterium]|jgi:flagellar biosynthesis protein FliQ